MSSDTGTRDNADLDAIEARWAGFTRQEQIGAGETLVVSSLLAELRLERSGMDAVAQHYAEKNWCDICRKTLALANPDAGWEAGHKPDCPLAAYTAFREGRGEENKDGSQS